jgi:hypothetical protein
MFRYIIVTGDPRNPSDDHSLNEIRRYLQRSPLAWRSSVDLPGFYAAYIDNGRSLGSAMQLHDKRGVIVGNVYPDPDSFECGAPKPMRFLSRAHSEAIVQSQGRSLISRYWGYYVAAIHYPERSSVVVMRSPVSSLPCLHLKLGTLNVFFSYYERLHSLEAGRAFSQLG